MRISNALGMEPPAGLLEMLLYLGLTDIFIRSDCSAGKEDTCANMAPTLSISSREL